MVAALRAAVPLQWPRHLREDATGLDGLQLAAQARDRAAGAPHTEARA